MEDHLSYLTGATSDKKYRLSGFSAYPSVGPTLQGYTQAIQEKNSLFDEWSSATPIYGYGASKIWDSATDDPYLGGIGLYADYIDNCYYWYIFSRTIDTSYWAPGIQTTLEFYTLSGESKTPFSQPALYASESDNEPISDWNTYYSSLYLMPAKTDDEYSDSRRPGASLGFWPFVNSQNYYTCFIKGSRVKLANGSYKNIEDVVPGDVVSYITNYGTRATTVVVAPPCKGTCSDYINYIFEDGTILPIYKNQGIWCEEKQSYVTVLEWEIGWTTKKIDGTLTKLVAKQVVNKSEGAEDFEHYFLYTYNGNYSVNDVLTCTAREKALVAYLNELKQGSKFVLPEAQVIQWKKEVTIRYHKEHPLTDKPYKELVRATNAQIELNNQLIKENKKNLDDTDYKVQKYLEGVLSEEEFNEVKATRESWRASINNLEAQNLTLTEQLAIFKRKFEMKPSRPDYPSIAPDTQVLMADGTYKAIKDIKVGEEVLYLSDDKQHIRNSLVVLPVEPSYVWEYKLYKFSDGTELKLHGQTNLFDIARNRYYPEKEMKIGDLVRKIDGTEVAIESVENVKLDHEEIFYRVSTFNGNFAINDILSLVSRIRTYDELMWEENEPFRLSDEVMEEWKNWCDARR